MLYHTNANSINSADMQNSQFCYDRTSVPLYPSGEAQDTRSLPPSNAVNHQLGGKSYDPFMSCDNQSDPLFQTSSKVPVMPKTLRDIVCFRAPPNSVNMRPAQLSTAHMPIAQQSNIHVPITQRSNTWVTIRPSNTSVAIIQPNNVCMPQRELCTDNCCDPNTLQLKTQRRILISQVRKNYAYARKAKQNKNPTLMAQLNNDPVLMAQLDNARVQMAQPQFDVTKIPISNCIQEKDINYPHQMGA